MVLHGVLQDPHEAGQLLRGKAGNKMLAEEFVLSRAPTEHSSEDVHALGWRALLDRHCDVVLS